MTLPECPARRDEGVLEMVGQQWFVYPVENGVELVIDSTDGDVYDRALAEFVAHFTDYNIAAEWSVEGGEIINFVPAFVDDDSSVRTPRTIADAA